VLPRIPCAGSCIREAGIGLWRDEGKSDTINLSVNARHGIADRLSVDKLDVHLAS
jgi:hypothetical protein